MVNSEFKLAHLMTNFTSTFLMFRYLKFHNYPQVERCWIIIFQEMMLFSNLLTEIQGIKIKSVTEMELWY